MSDIKSDTSITQLKNMFYYTFGIVPLDSYNVVGDGITDNRLQIQQAINDAISKNVQYIFVSKGEYYYSNSLNNTDQVTFIGNSVEASIEGIDIVQFPEQHTPTGAVILFSGDTVPDNYEEVTDITAPTGYTYIKKVR